MDEHFGLGERGSAIFQALATGVSDPARIALITEAARTADRLDELDNIIQGKGVLNLMQFRLDFPSEDGEPFTVEVKFQNVLAEARQQTLAFANVLKTLGLDSAVAPAAPVAAPKTGKDMLEQKRAERASKRSG
ncbi:hypothetical protein AHiyo6_02850 [Arthrobacter sp. Hiyo6]|nr:hypothetical protein AHiyo6_02850 [Arthrobacter sp. Hiyo6]